MSACPYGDCPRGGGQWCDCPDVPSPVGVEFQPEPYPCEGCYVWSGDMKACDGCCAALTATEGQATPARPTAAEGITIASPRREVSA